MKATNKHTDARTTIYKEIEHLMHARRRHMRYLAVLVVCAVLVSVGVAARLRFPGIAMTHEEQVLDCPLMVDDEAQDEEDVEQEQAHEKLVAHKHDDSCYDAFGNLVCTLEERELHEHTDACYEENHVLSCQIAEGEGAHAHDETCYDEAGELICGLEESAGHVHAEDCYEIERKLVCGEEEITEEHVHGPGCFVTETVEDPEPEPEDEAPEAAAQDVAADEEAYVEEAEQVVDEDVYADDAADEQAEDAFVDALADDGVAEESYPVDDPATDEAADEPAAEEPAADETEEPADQAADEAASEQEAAADDGEEAPEGTHELTLTYETSDMTVSAHITDEGLIPTDAELRVSPITPDMPDYAAYLTALNRDFDSDVYTSDNALLFDVTVVAAGQRFEPQNGRIELSINFKNNQLSEELGVDAQAEGELQVIHLPVVDPDFEPNVDEPGNDALAPDDIACEYVDADVSMGGTEAVSFELSSLSVITVANATTDVNVTASLQGTDMKALGYNLYAYLLASNSSKAYGAKIEFAGGQATATIPNVPANTYRLYLAYRRDNGTMTVPEWNYNNVLDSNANNWVDADGAFILGYTAKMPADKTITAADNTIGFTLEVPNIQSSVSVKSIMDRAIRYGIVAEDIEYHVRAYTNFAAKHINIANSNDSTTYGHRADGVDVVPNILASVDNNGQPLSTADKPVNYYVVEDDKGKVSSANQEDTIVRNQHEIEDRVEIMLSNTLKQCDALAASSSLVLPQGTSVDVSPYPANATIILDATAISGELNGYTITKRPGQTVVFNIGGANAAPPQNIKVKLVNEFGQQVDVEGNPSTKTYMAGDEMRNAAAIEGNVWSRIVWNLHEATSVTATNAIGGIFLVPNGDFNAANKGGGWIVARGKVSVTNEWYGFPGSDEPFKQKIIRKTFVGIGEDEVRDDFAIKLWTHTNESTQGTTMDRLITTLVLKEQGDVSLIVDPSGETDQTGYLSKSLDADGNLVIEWQTPSISVGNEHKLTEVNTTSTNGQAVDLIDFQGPYSVWSDAANDYVWTTMETTATNEADFAGIFNVSSHNDDWRLYTYVTNYYNYEPEPHDLTLTKAVVDPEGIEPAGQTYTFEVSLADDQGAPLADQALACTINGTEQTVNLVGGKATLTLAKDDVVVFLGLPFGTQYTITETNLPDKCAVAFSGDTSSASVGTGKLLRDRSVTATNTFSDDPGVPVTAHKDLIDGALKQGQFTFRLVDASGNLVKQATNDANGNITFGTLTFDQDGTYDYELYEVANPEMTDVVFDPSVFGVHLVVEGGRVREVEYSTGDGRSTLIPMFRNRHIPTDSDTLTAHKVFVDEVSGKAVKLEGGEFTFTATSTDEPAIVYTGTNDADGMVTFVDAAGKVVDLNELTQPTTFTIAETSTYEGEVPADHELIFDTATHEATAEVHTTTVSTNPVSVVQEGNDNATVSITFTPSVAADHYYHVYPNGGAATVEPRSDGSVTMTIPISKSQTQTNGQWRTIQVEYGTGTYYGAHTALGSIAITARGGNWGSEPITVGNVSIPGVDLSPKTEVIKTVTLSYAEGHYPTFTNKLVGTEPTTTEFPFTKVWVDNVSYANPREWQVGQAINVHLTGTFAPDGEGQATSRVYDFGITRTSDGFAFAQPEGAGAPQIGVATASSGAGHYGFVISGLASRETLDGVDGTWSYRLTEDSLGEGYAVSYGTWDEAEQKAVPDQALAAHGIKEGGYLINAQVTVELPAAGGVGVWCLYLCGCTLIVLGAALLAFKGRRA